GAAAHRRGAQAGDGSCNRRRTRGRGQRSHGRVARRRPENAETAGSITNRRASLEVAMQRPRGICSLKIFGGKEHLVTAILVLLLTLGWSSTLLAQAPFYQGKTISILIGTKAGDVYDLYPRLLAEFWTKYIPGNPNIIIQNVPGAASLIAANQAYNVSKSDGLTLAAIYPALYFDQLIKRPEVKYDWAKWNWLGSPVKSNQLLYMRADTPYKSIDDVRKAATAPKCGSTG